MQLIIKNELGTSVIEITPELREIIASSSEDEDVTIQPVVKSDNGSIIPKKSFRIQLEETDVDFMEEYKEQYGTPIQWFVERSVKKEIMRIRLTPKTKEDVI